MLALNTVADYIVRVGMENYNEDIHPVEGAIISNLNQISILPRSQFWIIHATFFTSFWGWRCLTSFLLDSYKRVIENIGKL